ncbi:hypothetical protein Lal_00039901 [Lupinus albus]|nr:hypothetical protein Lal_00039901 [Lupinus albus]
MTRGNTGHLHPINPEIDRTYHRLVRQSRNLSFHSVPDSVSDSDSISNSIPVSVHSVQYTDFVHSENSVHSENMAQPPTPPGPRERTLRELAAPDFTYDSEDPHKHLKEFHIVCSTMKPHDVQEDHICLKAFPHSLEGPAKDWLYYLAPGSITSWGDLKRTLLGKFFPASRTTAIRKDISGIRQQHGESLYEYWERFKRSIIDVASGGALGDMTPFEARGLIEKMASNSQQFKARSIDAIILRGVHDVGTDSVRQEKLERKIDSLTALVTQLAMNQQKQPMARVCGICTSPDHYSDVCPSLLEPRTTDHPEAYAANIYNNRPNQQQQNYDPSSSRYNLGWRNHPNLKWSDHTQQQPPHAPFQKNNVGHNRPYVPPPIQQQRQQQVINNPPPVPSEPSLVTPHPYTAISDVHKTTTTFAGTHSTHTIAEHHHYFMRCQCPTAKEPVIRGQKFHN